MDIMTMIVVVIALVAVFTLIVTRMAFKHEENQMQAEAREELSTLFNDPATVQSWLDRMPLKAVQTQ
jgi:flagellar basal body-associated protein FliL